MTSIDYAVKESIKKLLCIDDDTVNKIFELAHNSAVVGVCSSSEALQTIIKAAMRSDLLDVFKNDIAQDDKDIPF